MDLPFELHIALRYLLAKRKQAFISVISLISTLGVTVGVMALVIALALMTGLPREIRDRILGANPHIYVWKTSGIADYRAESDRLRQLPHVVGAAPAILGKAMVSSARSPDFVNLTGIDPALEASVSDLKSALQSGSLDALNPSGDHDLELGGTVGAAGMALRVRFANVVTGPPPRARAPAGEEDLVGQALLDDLAVNAERSSSSSCLPRSSVGPPRDAILSASEIVD